MPHYLLRFRYLRCLRHFAYVSAVMVILGYCITTGTAYAGDVTMTELPPPGGYADGARNDGQGQPVTPGYGTGSQVTTNGAAEMEAAKKVIVKKAAAGVNDTPAALTSPNALQPAGLYAIPEGHDRVKAAAKPCNLVDNIPLIGKPLSSISLNTPYFSTTIGGCDPSVAPVLDGPGAMDGLELFKRDYKGNKYGSAMGTLAGWTNFALPFVSIIAIIAIIYAGFLYLTAFGNEEQTGKAKKIIIWVVVGIVIIISAYALVNTVISGSSG